MRMTLIAAAVLLLAGCDNKAPEPAPAPPPAAAPAPAPAADATAPAPAPAADATAPAPAAAPASEAAAPAPVVVAQAAQAAADETDLNGDEDLGYQEPPPQPVVSVYQDPPIDEPEPVQIGWAPPPMLDDVPPPQPYPDGYWTGGYWAWQGDWVWVQGRWLRPPREGYGWVPPYYENRDGNVIFVNGYWGARGVAFVPPRVGISIAVGIVAAGVVIGPRLFGPPGIFVPAPPGSRRGLYVPAPLGTAPQVVMGAPPIVRSGMRVTNITNNTTINNTTINRNVTIVAPASATANHTAFNGTAPAAPHLAAAQASVVKVPAPRPVSATPVAAYVPGKPLAPLPPAQTVKASVPPALIHAPAPRPQPNAGAKTQVAPNSPLQRPVPTPAVRPAPAPAPRPIEQPAAKAQVRPAPAPVARPEPLKPAPRPAPAPAPRPEARPVPAAKAEPRPAPAPKPEARPAPRPAPAAAPRPEPKPAPRPEAKPAPAPAPHPAPAPKPEPKPAPKPGEKKKD